MTGEGPAPRPSPESWQQVSELLDVAMDLPPEARPAWLPFARRGGHGRRHRGGGVAGRARSDAVDPLSRGADRRRSAARHLGHAGRRLPPGGTDRPGRHGHGLAGRSQRRPVRPARRRQAAQRGVARRQQQRALRPRGRHPGAADPPADRPPARRRHHPLGDAVPGARAGRRRAHRPLLRRPAAERARSGPRVPRRPAAGRPRARQPGGPPRPEAVQRPGDARGPRPAARLRHRQAAAVGAVGHDGHRRDPRGRPDTGLRRARAAHRRANHDPHRRLRAGRAALPAAHRPPSVSGRCGDAGGAGQQHRREAADARLRCRRRSAGGAGCHRRLAGRAAPDDARRVAGGVGRRSRHDSRRRAQEGPGRALCQRDRARR